MVNRIFSQLPITIFTKMSALAQQHQAINLGQGFPDFGAPNTVIQAASDYLLTGNNQYPPMQGVPELRQAIAAHAKRFYNLSFPWQTETLVTSGATEALTASILAMVSSGDEVLLFAPCYDSYAPIIAQAGGTAKYIHLMPPEWSVTKEMILSKVTEKTRLIILNSPMNPTGKVFSSKELQVLADIASHFDLHIICDEVYEHLTYDQTEHHPLITFPKMRDRCIRIASAGKIFSLTGWKVGMISANAQLLAVIGKVHQFLTFTTPPNLQYGVAQGLCLPDVFFDDFAKKMQLNRDFLAVSLQSLGFETLPCQGGYFLTVDMRSAGFQEKDINLCQTLTENAKVASIPMSAFYADDQEAQIPFHTLRFAFCKKREILEQAIENLTNYMRYYRK